MASAIKPDAPSLGSSINANEIKHTPNAPPAHIHSGALPINASLPPSSTLDLLTYLSRPHVLLEMRGSGTPEIERALSVIRERRHVAISLPHWGVAPQLIEGTDLILTVSSRGVLNIDREQLSTVPPPFHIPSFAFELAWHARRGGDSGLQWLKAQVQGVLSEGCH